VQETLCFAQLLSLLQYVPKEMAAIKADKSAVVATERTAIAVLILDPYGSPSLVVLMPSFLWFFASAKRRKRSRNLFEEAVRNAKSNVQRQPSYTFS
jgi:hypothetical protein